MGNAPLAGPEPAKIARLRERVAEGLADPGCDWLERLAERCGDHTHAGPRGPLDALATTKRMLNTEWAMGLDEAIELEAQVQAVHLRAPDHKTFHAAFVAKQPPRFSGETRRDRPTETDA